MGLRTDVSRWIVSQLLKTDKTSRAVFEALAGRGILFFKETEDHGILYLPHDVIGREITKSGSFSRESVRDLRVQLETHGRYRPDMSLLEIGANIGTHTVYFFCDLAVGKVVAIEPDPENLGILKRNVALNGFSDRVVPVCAAISNSEGKADFVRNNLNRGGSHLAGEAGAGKQDNVFSVDVRTIDALLPDLDLKPTDIDLVWIDVEGHEREVLEGMGTLLAQHRPPVFMEYTPKPSSEHIQAVSAMMFEGYAHVYKYENGFIPLSPQDFAALQGQHDILLIN